MSNLETAKAKILRALLVGLIIIFTPHGAGAQALNFGTIDGAPISWTSSGNSVFTAPGGILQSNNTNFYASTFLSDSTYGPGAGDLVWTVQYLCSAPNDGGYSIFGWDPVITAPPCQGQNCNNARTGVSASDVNWTPHVTCSVYLQSGASPSTVTNPAPVCDGTWHTYKFIVNKTGGGASIFKDTTLMHWNPANIGALSKKFSITTQKGNFGVYNWQTFTAVTNGVGTAITITPSNSQYYLGTGGSATINATIAGYTGTALWRIDIVNAAGTTIRKYTGTGAAISQAWDGKDGSSVDQPLGNYTAYIVAWDDLLNPKFTSVTASIIPPPGHSFTALPQFTGTPTFNVQWSGIDHGNGIAGFNVQYKDATVAGPWTNWMMGTVATTGNFNLGVETHQYAFRAQAYDSLGLTDNYDADPGGTLTTIDLTPGTSAMTGLTQYQTSTTFNAGWSGSDPVSGIATYDVQYKDGALGIWTDWLTGTAMTTSNFIGTDGHNYFFQTRSTDHAGNTEAYPGGAGDTGTTVDATPPSSSVSGLTQYQTSTTFAATWSGTDAVSGLTNYDVQYKDGALGAWTNWLAATTLTTSNFIGTDGHTYYFQSRARDAAGNVEAYPGGNGDTSTTVDTSPPASSVSGLPQYQTSTTVAVIWSGTDATSGLTTYDVQYKDGPGGFWTDLLTGTALTTTNFIGADGHTYYFQSRARDNVGNVEAYPGGNGDTNTTVDTTPPASSVSGLTQYQTTTTFAVSWSASDATSGLATYDVQYKDGPGGFWTDLLTGTTLTTTNFIGADGHTYYFQSRARDNAGNIEIYPGGNGDTSTTVDATPPTSQVTALQQYSAVVSFAVSWSGSDAVSGIATYDIQYKDGPAGAWTDLLAATVLTTSTFNGTNGHTYYFQSRARDNVGNLSAYAGGNGDTSTTVDTTLLPAPASINDGPAADIDFTTSTTSLSGNWAAVPGAVKYFYGIGTTQTNPDVVAWTDNGAGTSAAANTLTLANGTTYYFLVKARNVSGIDGQIGSSNGIGVDTTPPASSVSNLPQYQTTAAFAVIWSGSDAVSGIATYDVQYKDGAAGAWTNWLAATTLTTSNFNGTDGHVYFFQSRATDNIGNVEAYPGGNGDTSTTVDATPPASQVAALQQYFAALTFAVSWSGSDALSGITTYDVQYKDGAAGAWSNWLSATALTTSNFTGVNGHTYYFQSRARDNAGNVEAYPGGNGDTNITVDTTLLPAPASISDGPAADIDFTTSTASLSGNWAAVPGAAKYFYGVGTTQTNPDVLAWTDNGAGTSATANALTLTNGTKYYFLVKARNVSGIDGQTGSSNGITVDATPPASSVSNLAQYQTSATFAVNWSGSDAVSGIAAYDVQYKDGAAGAWTNWLAATALTTSNFNGTDGHTYYFQSRATDNTGNVETYPGGDGDRTTAVDATPPASQVAALQQYSALVSFTVSWSGSDAVSGITTYDVQSRDGAAGAWTNWKTATTDTGATFTGVNGHTYYFQSRATDNAGNVETYPGGNGDTNITVNTTLLPAPALISDGSAADTDFTASTTALSANWAAIPGADKYFFGVGTTQINPDVLAWTDNGTNTSASANTLTLTNGTKYYFLVKARNVSGIDGQTGSSNGITVDTTLPTSLVAALAPYIATVNFAVAWSGSDAGAGIKNYDVQVKDGATGAWTDWKTATTDTGATFTGVNGHAYYFQSRATDNAGNVEAYPGGNGDANATVDTSILSPAAFLNDGTGADKDYTSSTTSLSANWAAVPGATKYSYAIGLSANDTSVLGWTDNGLNTSVTANGLTLSHNQKYYFLVRAHNTAGTPGQAAVSNGILVDTTSPLSPAVTDSGDTTRDPTLLTASWHFNDAESPIVEYQYAIGTTPGGTDVLAYTTVGIATSTTATDLKLDEKFTYYISVKALNAAGLWSAVGTTDGIAYRSAVLNITYVMMPQTLEMVPGEEKKVTFALSILGNVGMNFDKEKLIYELPTRTLQVEVKDISLIIPTGTSNYNIDRTIKLEDAITKEVLAGKLNGNITVQYVFTGNDSQNKPFTLTLKAPVSIKTTTTVYDTLKINTMTIGMEKTSLEKDAALKPTLTVAGTGQPGQVNARVMIDNSISIPVQFIATGQGKSDIFELPILPTDKAGTHIVKVILDSPNSFESNSATYEVALPKSTYAVETVTVSSDVKEVGVGDEFAAPIEIKVTGAGGTVTGVALLDGVEWKKISLECDGGGAVKKISSPPLPTDKEGSRKFQIRIDTPANVTSNEFVYNVTGNDANYPASLSLPHVNIATLTIKDDKGNLTVSAKKTGGKIEIRNKTGVNAWVVIKAVNENKQIAAVIPDSTPLVFEVAGDSKTASNWKLVDGSMNFDEPVATNFNVFGVTNIDKESGQTAPLLKLDKDGLTINGAGSALGAPVMKFKGVRFNAHSPAVMEDGQIEVDTTGLYLLIVADSEGAPIRFELAKSPVFDSKKLLYAATKIDSKFTADKDGIHFPNTTLPVDMSYSYGDIRTGDKALVKFTDAVAELLPGADKQLKSGGISFVLKSDVKTEVAAITLDDGFILRDNFKSDLIAKMIPDRIGLPSANIMYIKLKDASGNPLVKTDVGTRDSFSQAMSVKIISANAPLDVYIPALGIDENNDDDTDTPIKLTLPKDSGLELSCSPDCSKPENWKLVKGDVTLTGIQPFNYNGVTLKPEKITFTSGTYQPVMDGAVDFSLDGTNGGSVKFAGMKLSEQGMISTMEIKSGDASSPFNAGGATLKLDTAALYFETKATTEYLAGRTKKADDNIASLQSRIDGVKSQVAELDKAKKALDDKAAGLKTEMDALQKTASAKDGGAASLAAGARLASLTTIAENIAAQSAAADASVQAAKKMQSGLETNLQALQSLKSGLASKAPKSDKITVVYIQGMKGAVVTLPVVGAPGADGAAAFENFSLVYDPFDGFKPKASGLLSFGDKDWYMTNSNNTYSGKPLAGTPIFSKDLWSGALKFSLYYAMIAFNEGVITDAGFSGGTSYKLPSGGKAIESAMNMMYDPAAGTVIGGALLPAMDGIKISGMALKSDGGNILVAYDVNKQTADVRIQGLSGALTELPAPLGKLKTPVLFDGAYITEQGFTGVFSIAASNVALKELAISGKGDTRRASISALDINVRNGKFVKGSVTASIGWDRGDYSYSFPGVLAYAEDGSISGEIANIKLPGFDIDNQFAFDVDGGKIVIAKSGAALALSMKDVSIKITKLPLMSSYDAAKNPMAATGCSWGDSGLSCDVRFNADKSCAVAKDAKPFLSLPLYSAEKNANFAFDLSALSVCADIKDSKLASYKVGARAELKLLAAGSPQIVYSGDAALALSGAGSDAVLSAAIEKVDMQKIAIKDFGIDFDGGRLDLKINGTKATGEFSKLSGKIVSLPGMAAPLAAKPIIFQDFTIAAAGISGFIETAAGAPGLAYKSELYGSPVELNMTRIRFAPDAFAVNGTVKVTAKGTAAQDSIKRIDDKCLPFEVPVDNAGFLYAGPLALNYGTFKSTACPVAADDKTAAEGQRNVDIELNKTGFLSGIQFVLPPIPLPAYNKAYLDIRTEIPISIDATGKKATGSLKSIQADLHLTFNDSSFPSDSKDIKTYNAAHPDSHRIVTVKIEGGATFSCDVSGSTMKNCKLDAFPKDASISAEINPPLTFEKSSFSLELSKLSYSGSATACGTAQPALGISAVIKKLPGIGDVGSIKFDPLYITTSGLCGTASIVLPEVSLAGFVFKIDEGTVEFTATKQKQDFKVKKIAGSVKKVPGFDLTKYNPTFSASMDGKDYDFSLKVSNLVEDKSIGGFKISVKEVSAEVTPAQKKLSIKAAVTLPSDLKYASGTIEVAAHALYDSTAKKVKFGLDGLKVTDASLSVSDFAKLEISKAYLEGGGIEKEEEEDKPADDKDAGGDSGDAAGDEGETVEQLPPSDAMHMTIETATMTFKIGGTDRAIGAKNLRIYSDHVEFDEIHVNQRIGVDAFNVTIGDLAFVRPVDGDKYFTLTGGIGLSAGAASGSVTIEHLHSLKIFKGGKITLSEIAFEFTASSFSLAGKLSMIDLPNDQKVEVIKPAGEACKAIFAENIYLQDTDDKSDFVGSAKLNVMDKFGFDATVAFLSNGDFGAYLSLTLPPPGITPAPPVPIAITGVFGGIMYRKKPTMFALSIGGDISITGTGSLISGRGAFTAVFGTPTLINLCANFDIGKLGDDPICSVSGSATFFLTGYKGFLGTLAASCKIPPKSGDLLDASLTANVCLREVGGCIKKRESTDTLAKCFTGSRTEPFNFDGSAVLVKTINTKVAGAMSSNGFDIGASVDAKGNFGAAGLQVNYSADMDTVVCKIGVSGTWGSVKMDGSAGLSLWGYNLASVRLVGDLGLTTSPWSFSGRLGAGACVGWRCGGSGTCDSCRDGCCPNNPGKLVSSSCGSNGSCLGFGWINAAGAIVLKFDLGKK